MRIVLLETVETLLETLDQKELAKVIRTIELLEEFGSKLGMPHSRYVTDGLRELRIRGKRDARIFTVFMQTKRYYCTPSLRKHNGRRLKR